MKSIHRKGITLTELLVAGMLIGIVMVGIIAVSFAIKKMQDTTNKAAILAMRTTALVTRMTKDVAIAVGYQDEPGIILGEQGSERWVSVRQESGDDLNRFDDDPWVIYHYNLDDHKLYVCSQQAKDGPEPKPSNCSENKSELISANVMQAEFSLLNDPDKYEFYLEVYLETIYDATQAHDIINNPNFVVTSRMSPAGHSW